MSAVSVISRLSRALAAFLVVSLCVARGTAAVSAADATPLSCSVTGSSVDFGQQIDVLPGTPVQTTGLLTVRCLSLPIGYGTLYVCVALATPLLQSSAGGTLSYTLDGPGTSSPWSSTTPISLQASVLTSGGNIPFTGVLAGQQTNAAPGSYGQTLTATAYIGTTGCTTGITQSTALTFSVSATVLKSCNVSAAALSFGTVGSLAAPVDGQSNLGVTCTKGTPYTVALDGGLSGATDPTARLMTANSASISYGLYQNAPRSKPWGTSSATAAGGTGTAAIQTLPVYGRIPVQPTPPPGNYSDTIVVTVTY